MTPIKNIFLNDMHDDWGKSGVVSPTNQATPKCTVKKHFIFIINIFQILNLVSWFEFVYRLDHGSDHSTCSKGMFEK